MDRFIQGLKPAIRAQVSAQNFESLHKAVIFAERLGRQDTIPMELDAIQDQGRQTSGSHHRHTRTGKGPRCYTCNQFGHIAKNCPHRAQANVMFSGNASGQDNNQEAACPTAKATPFLEQ
ncbi:hypothetical protein IWQ60_006463 [Tieghemiomyces parasiticus]|uniref:CCHC-type domain-containing protein n=1 Tax=Tieghemiomyces parasiticus TaxID=78921 RepID=A0A9W8DS58_9FUNG|nr:hypothetical protein IWQ60_006463 [Tieghemiomyces parasiticus]